ncbi:hypothetical protein B7990_11800 [Fibrobacter sp. UWB4]|uniref:hypothetical protein n=1 Tax=Fibrobacter sp. UWB4 TaxID=1964356 RepID=UPI000B525675|nr:hypothetical protein [Fibrobacter sp. UWB4]OWV16417.1 hypothetical protein B7990_11800 [Fibrobacter sp. UWB4]
MNIAFLISVYKDPAQLKRLINALQGDGSHFFIHVDKKVDISSFLQICPEFHADNQSLTYLEKRFPVYWGGFSQFKLIARKFASNKSEKLIEKLQKQW